MPLFTNHHMAGNVSAFMMTLFTEHPLQCPAWVLPLQMNLLGSGGVAFLVGWKQSRNAEFGTEKMAQWKVLALQTPAPKFVFTAPTQNQMWHASL